MSLKFVAPKNEKVRPPKYATYVATQWGNSLKTHSEIGHAKNSLRNRAGQMYYGYGSQTQRKWRQEAFLIEFVDGEMFVLAHWTTEDAWDHNKWNRIPTGEEYIKWRIAVDREIRSGASE